MSTIRITPDELRSAAAFFESKAEEIRNQIGELNSKVEEVCGEWEGAAQTAFFEGFQEVLPTIRDDFPEILEGIKYQLEGAADALEQADGEVANAFRGN